MKFAFFVHCFDRISEDFSAIQWENHHLLPWTVEKLNCLMRFANFFAMNWKLCYNPPTSCRLMKIAIFSRTLFTIGWISRFSHCPLQILQFFFFLQIVSWNSEFFSRGPLWIFMILQNSIFSSIFAKFCFFLDRLTKLILRYLYIFAADCWYSPFVSDVIRRNSWFLSTVIWPNSWFSF